MRTFAIICTLLRKTSLGIGSGEVENTSVFSLENLDAFALVAAKTLLIVDRGFYHFLFWSQLQSKGVDVICRLKAGAAYTDRRTFTDRAGVKDLLIRPGVKRILSAPVANAFGAGKIRFSLV